MTPAERFEQLYDLYAPLTLDEDGRLVRHPGWGLITREEFFRMMEAPMSNDDQMNAARQAQAAMNQSAQYAQQAYVDPEQGISGMLRRATREENEACAVLAESHGFPELARHIRMRVSTSDQEKK